MRLPRPRVFEEAARLVRKNPWGCCYALGAASSGDGGPEFKIFIRIFGKGKSTGVFWFGMPDSKSNQERRYKALMRCALKARRMRELAKKEDK